MQQNSWAWIVPKQWKRPLILVTLLVLVFAYDCWHRRWLPAVTMTTAHYTIRSSATFDQTKKIADVVESLYPAYTAFFAHVPSVTNTHALLRLNLYKDSAEFRRCNRVLTWAEAFYRAGCCYAYYSADEANPYHWMLHEAAHQLNAEVGRLDAPQWIDEGLADYFGSSQVSNTVLLAGVVDANTYPLWWLASLQPTGNLDFDIAATNIIPVRTIVAGKGGPNINTFVNLYYVQWWSLTHFLINYDHGQYRTGFFKVIQEGGTPASFERHIGPFSRIQAEWYQYFQTQCAMTTHPGAARR